MIPEILKIINFFLFFFLLIISTPQVSPIISNYKCIKLRNWNMCPRSLVHFNRAIPCIKMDKNIWQYRTYTVWHEKMVTEALEYDKCINKQWNYYLNFQDHLSIFTVTSIKRTMKTMLNTWMYITDWSLYLFIFLGFNRTAAVHAVQTAREVRAGRVLRSPLHFTNLTMTVG